MHADHAVPPPAGPGQAAPLRAGVSFRKIVDVPSGTCVAALGSWQVTGHGGGRHGGPPLVCGPAEHDRDSGTCRVQVRLARIRSARRCGCGCRPATGLPRPRAPRWN